MSATIDAIRQKYPQYANVPDEKLVPAIGAKYPTYLQSDKEFAADYQRLNTPYIRPATDPKDVASSAKDFLAIKNDIEDTFEPPSEGTLREWHPTLYEKYRNSELGHVLQGPTDLERDEIAKGIIAGPPGNNPGIVPIMMATPGPFLPGNETKAGKALLAYFVASNLKQQPQVIEEVHSLLKTDSKENHKQAYKLILEDAINTTMAAGAAKGLHEGFTGRPAGLEEPATAAPVSGATLKTPPGAEPPPEPVLETRPAGQGIPFAGIVDPKLPKATVPETPAEPRESAIEEIRRKGAKTIADIQRLFPKRGLSREEARVFRNQAFPSEPQLKTPQSEVQSSQSAAAAAAPAPPVASPSADTAAAPVVEPSTSDFDRYQSLIAAAKGAEANKQIPSQEITGEIQAIRNRNNGLPPEPETATQLAKVPAVEFPVAKLKLSQDVPNFKGGASEETGTVAGEELSGKYQRLGTAPIVAWERLNGDVEVITGRHRFDLARRTAEKTIPTQIVREKDGFTKAMALTFDAEANIRDGQGDVSDYAIYFKGHPEYTEEGARARGLLARTKGRAGWDIGKNASNDLFALWQADKITDAQTMAIAKAAPGDGPAQQIGSKFALQGKPPEFLTNVIKASQAGARERAQSLDLFGNDDRAMQEMAAQASRAAKFQRELREQISAVSGAAKKPEVAARLGVNVNDPEGVRKKIDALRDELARWENWPMQPDLVAKVKAGATAKIPPPMDQAAPEKAAPGANAEEILPENPVKTGKAGKVEKRGGSGPKPFFPPTPPREQVEALQGDDLAGEVAERLLKFGHGEQPHWSESDQALFEQIRDWRARQKTGDTAPQWGRWNEFDVKLDGGQSVKVLAHPSSTSGEPWHDMELHGPITSTGYRSYPHIEPPDDMDPASFGKLLAEHQAKEFAAEQAKSEKTNKKGAGKPLFGAPESVEEQKARLDDEQRQRETKANKDKVAQGAAKPLVGSTGDIGQTDLLGGGDLLSDQAARSQIGTHPLDNRTADSVASVYAVKPEQFKTALQDTTSYQQSFDFNRPERSVSNEGTADSPGQSKGADSGRLEAEREALKTLDAAALSKAFGYDTRISSIDPKAAPREIPQYRVNGTIIKSPADFAKTLVSLRSPYSESLKIAILNRVGRVIHSQVLFSGSVDSTVADARDFVRLANEFKDKGGTRILISHNHPSGDPTPSAPDIQITNKIEEYVKQAGFELVDHIITNGRKFYSIRTHMEASLDDPPTAAWEKVWREELKIVSDSDSFKKLVNSLRQSNPDVAHIVYLTTRETVSAIERIAPELSDIRAAVIAGISREGARNVIVDFGPHMNASLASMSANSINMTLKATTSRIIDFAAQGVVSARAEGSFFADAPKREGALNEEKKERTAAMGSAAARPAKTGPVGPAIHPVPRAGSIAPAPHVAKLPVPALGALDTWWKQATLGFRRIFMPQTIDAGAAETAYTMRQLMGEKAIALQRAEQQMNGVREEFDRTPVPPDYVYDPAKPLPHNYAVIDALERNRAALPARYKKFGDFLDREFAWRIDLIRKFAPNALQHLISNYFPHLWEDPERAKGVMAQIATKHFAGAKEFLKQRTLPFFVEGLARGLKPINDNPVDLLLAKMHSMDQFILSLKAQAQFKATGKLKFNYWAETPPDGHVRLDDPAFIIHAPPFVEFKEGFDEMLRARTLDGMKRLGIPTQRLASLGGRRWGVAFEATREVHTRFGGDTFVYWHELGHQLDFMYPDLRPDLGMTKGGRGGTVTDKELRDLADLRGGRKEYIRNAEEKMANVFHAYLHAPELFVKTAPNVAAALDGWLAKHTDVRDVLNEIRQPSLKLGVGNIQVPTAGPVLLGYWTMPDGPAQVIKNYLSPGLIRFKAFQNLRSASNLLNAAQLGFSGFHLGFTSLDATVNAVEVGMFQALHGMPMKGAGTILKAPLAPVANYYVGKAIRTAMLDPKATTMKVWGMDVKISQAAHDYGQLAVKAGLRATLDPFWKTHFTRGLVRAVGQVRNAWENNEGIEAPLRAAWATKTLPLRAAAALAEQAMRPIAEFLVPNQKLGVFALLTKSELARLKPGASEVEIQAALARAANATEDRMGQMTYDNLFYNRLAKDLLLLGTRSYGWQFGKYRHLAGAVSDTAIGARRLLGDKTALDKPEGITHRQLYFIALPMVLGAIGGMLHYLWTGRRPKDVVDLLHPSTGQADAYGQEKRVSLPSYWKDLEADWYGMRSGLESGGPAGAARGLWDSTYQRANPWINEIVEMLRNRDFYGQQIYSPTDPLDKKIFEQAAYMGKNFEPFSISQSVHLSAGDSSTMEKVLPFIGIVPAKQGLVMSPAQVKAAQLMRDMMPDVPQTLKQKQHSKLVADLVHDLRTGKINDEGQFEARARGAGVQTKAQLTMIQERVLWTPLQYQIHKLPLYEPGSGRDAMTVWDLMNNKERLTTAQVFADKIQRAFDGGKLDPETTSRMVKQVMPYLKAAAAAKAQTAASGPAAGRSSMYQQ